MRRAVIVIGCSYGDEGKGLASAHSVRRLGNPCLNVLINGGAQRGHTVDLPDGRRHVFHHFGSGSLDGAVSCAAERFIVNPLVYWQERDALAAEFGLAPRLLVASVCRATTPWDMMLGQIIEENRGKARHGSCGMGIQETRLRYMNTDWCMNWGQLAECTESQYRQYCRRIIGEYLPQHLASLGMTAGAGWTEIIRNPGLIDNSWADLQAMRAETEMYTDWAALAAGWDSLVFEAGQGLALDADNRADFPYLTPSSTTSLDSARHIRALAGETETEILYVTRSYLTRHGAGPLPGECPKEEINPDIVDRTNVPNPHQQSLRYARFDEAAVMDRVGRDLEATRRVLPGAAAAVLVTHLNETNGALFGEASLSEFTGRFDRAYVSSGPSEVEPWIQRAARQSVQHSDPA